MLANRATCYSNDKKSNRVDFFNNHWTMCVIHNEVIEECAGKEDANGRSYGFTTNLKSGKVDMFR